MLFIKPVVEEALLELAQNPKAKALYIAKTFLDHGAPTASDIILTTYSNESSLINVHLQGYY